MMEQEGFPQTPEQKQAEESPQLSLQQQEQEAAVAVLNKAKCNEEFRRVTLVINCCEQENPYMIRKLLQMYSLECFNDPEQTGCIYKSEIATMELFQLLLALADDPIKALTSIDYNYDAEICHLAKAVSRGYVQVLQLVAEQAPEAFSVRHDRYGSVLRQALSEVDNDCEAFPNGGFLSSPVAMKLLIEQHPEAEQAEISCLLHQRCQSRS